MLEKGKIVIVNDSIIFAKQLRAEMLKYFNEDEEDIVIMSHFNQEYIYRNNIDLLLLDVGKEWRGVSVMQEAIKIREHKHCGIEIVFITPQIDFINNLVDAKSLYFVYKAQWKKYLFRVLQTLHRKEFRDDYIYTINGNQIRIRDMIYVYAYDDIVYFHMRGNKTITVKANFDEIEKALNKRKCCRIHKWYIVNMISIKRKYSDAIILWNNIRLPISKSYQQKFKSIYKVAKMKEII